MPTATEQRSLITLTLPTALAKILDQEATLTGSSIAPLIRRIVKWHRGIALGRHGDSPKVKLGNRTTKPNQVKKGVLVDEDDVQHIDSIAWRIGITRVQALILIILDYFEIPPLSPGPKA